MFCPTRRSLLPRRPGWMDNLLNFFSGLQKLEQRAKGGFTHTMPFPCRVKDRFTHTMPFPCRDPANLRQCCVLRNSPCGRSCRHPATNLPSLDGHTMPSPCHEPAVKGIFVAWQVNGMVCVNQTRPHCVNQMGKTQSKPLAGRHGRGTVEGNAWERHGMCESTFTGLTGVE